VFVEVYEDHVDIRCFDMCNGAANYANWVENIKRLLVEIPGVGDRFAVFSAIIVGEFEKLLGVCEQVVGIKEVDILEYNGRGSEGGGCLAGQIRPLRFQDAIFSAVKKELPFSILQLVRECCALE